MNGADLGALQPANLSGEAALGASSGVLVHRALAYGLVDALDCETELLVDVVVSSLGCSEYRTSAGTQLGADRTIASVALFCLAVALDLALNVCHGGEDLYF